MPNRFDTAEFRGREITNQLKAEIEEKVKQFLFDEGCYGSHAIANVMIELIWGTFQNKKKED